MRKTDGQYSYTFRYADVTKNCRNFRVVGENRPRRAHETPGTFSVALEEEDPCFASYLLMMAMLADFIRSSSLDGWMGRQRPGHVDPMIP
jgi:hypothetical protein